MANKTMHHAVIGADTFELVDQSARADVSDLKNLLSDIAESVPSANVLDITKAVSGYYVNQTTGAYEANANQTVIKECPISENTVVISTTVQAWNFAVRYALYDSNKAYKSGGLLNTQSDWSNSSGRNYHSIDATGASYISISASSANVIFADSAKTQIANGDIIPYVPFGDVLYTKVDSSSGLLVKNEISRVEDLAIHGNDKSVQQYNETNLANGSFISLSGQTLLKEYTIVFNGVLSAFSKLTIGVCQNQNTLLNRVDIDSTTVTNKTFFGTVTSYTHGLTIENDIQVRIKVNYNLTADLTILSNGNKFEQTIQWVSTTTPMSPFALSDGVVTSSCKLTMVSDWNRPIYAVGDSYFNYATNRWAYYLDEYEYISNVLINASPGVGSNQAKTTLATLVAHGSPKYIIWAMGMNDGSDNSGTPQAQWMSGVNDFLAFCTENSIVPIFATVPTVPTINNEAKNSWIRSSGYRYIDIAKAVGADSSGDWYDGMLETTTPRIHPTVEGARCMFMQAISDFPEIMVGR